MAQSPDSDTTTEGIRVHATAEFLPGESSTDHDHYVFAYHITITNEGEQPARLLRRHWVILDAVNGRQEVEGPGVVGETPRLETGESFSYSSACPLSTTWGTMEGSYSMERDDGSSFEALVGRFFLSSLAPRTA